MAGLPLRDKRNKRLTICGIGSGPIGAPTKTWTGWRQSWHTWTHWTRHARWYRFTHRRNLCNCNTSWTYHTFLGHWSLYWGVVHQTAARRCLNKSEQRLGREKHWLAQQHKQVKFAWVLNTNVLPTDDGVYKPPSPRYTTVPSRNTTGRHSPYLVLVFSAPIPSICPPVGEPPIPVALEGDLVR